MTDPGPWPDMPEGLARAIERERAHVEAAVASSLPGLKAQTLDKVLRGVGPSILGGSSLTLVVVGGAALAVGVVLGAYGFAPQPTPPYPKQVAVASPVDGESSPKPASVMEPASVDDVLPKTTQNTDPGPTPTTSPRRTPDTDLRSTASLNPKAAPGGPSAPKRRTARSPSTERPTPTLADELRIFERAEAAASEGRTAAARREYASYLKRFPKGSLVVEARLGAAELALRSGDRERARALLAAIERDGLASPLRRQLERLDQEALAAP